MPAGGACHHVGSPRRLVEAAGHIQLSSRPSDRREREPGSMDGPGAKQWNGPRLALAHARLARSAEHTSELPSLMRHSYDVFCLKKQNTRQINIQHTLFSIQLCRIPHAIKIVHLTTTVTKN